MTKCSSLPFRHVTKLGPQVRARFRPLRPCRTPGCSSPGRRSPCRPARPRGSVGGSCLPRPAPTGTRKPLDPLSGVITTVGAEVITGRTDAPPGPGPGPGVSGSAGRTAPGRRDADRAGTCLLQLIMVTNKAIASQISQIKHFFHCILVVVCPNSSMYLIMSGSDGCA